MSITAPSESRYLISDQWLDDHANDRAAYIDIINLTSNYPEYFVMGAVGQGSNAKANPRGISVNGALDDNGRVDNDATAAAVAGLEIGEMETIRGYDQQTLSQDHPAIIATHVTHALRFKKIFAYGTTARGIWIHQ